MDQDKENEQKDKVIETKDKENEQLKKVIEEQQKKINELEEQIKKKANQLFNQTAGHVLDRGNNFSCSSLNLNINRSRYF